ncbi:hypothetical protein FRC11_009182 [Ceratobasidium sp. 423]|nr:hypothetical protein FRC11_009182 [Ceratobasidium sp. 423]
MPGREGAGSMSSKIGKVKASISNDKLIHRAEHELRNDCEELATGNEQQLNPQTHPQNSSKSTCEPKPEVMIKEAGAKPKPAPDIKAEVTDPPHGAGEAGITSSPVECEGLESQANAKSVAVIIAIEDLDLETNNNVLEDGELEDIDPTEEGEIVDVDPEPLMYILL